MKQRKVCIEFLLLVLVPFVLTYFSTQTSPYYEYSLFTDANIYMSIADELLHGKILYKEIVDWKGPFLFLSYAFLEQITGGEKTLYPLFSLTAMSYISSGIIFYKLAEHEYIIYSKHCSESGFSYIDRQVDKQRVYLVTIIYMVYSWLMRFEIYGGGSPEEYIALWYLITLYGYKRGYYRIELGGNKGADILKYICFYIMQGFFIGATALIKISLCVLWFTLYIFIGLQMLKEKRIKLLMTVVLTTLVGLSIPATLSFAYLIKHEAFTDFIRIYFKDNMSYVERTLQDFIMPYLEVGIPNSIYSHLFDIIVIFTIMFLPFSILRRYITYKKQALIEGLQNDKELKQNLYDNLSIYTSLLSGYILCVFMISHHSFHYHYPLFVGLLFYEFTDLSKLKNLLKITLLTLTFGVMTAFDSCSYINSSFSQFDLVDAKIQELNTDSISLPLDVCFTSYIRSAKGYPKYFFLPLTVHINNSIYWEECIDALSQQKVDYLLISVTKEETTFSIRASYTFQYENAEITNTYKNCIYDNYAYYWGGTDEVPNFILLKSKDKFEEENGKVYKTFREWLSADN